MTVRTMDLKSELIEAAKKHCDQAGISLPRLATLVANDGKFFARLEAGGGLTIKMYERFMAYFEEHGSRPAPTEPHGAAA